MVITIETNKVASYTLGHTGCHGIVRSVKGDRILFKEYLAAKDAAEYLKLLKKLNLPIHHGKKDVSIKWEDFKGTDARKFLKRFIAHTLVRVPYMYPSLCGEILRIEKASKGKLDPLHVIYLATFTTPLYSGHQWLFQWGPVPTGYEPSVLATRAEFDQLMHGEEFPWTCSTVNSFFVRTKGQVTTWNKIYASIRACGRDWEKLYKELKEHKLIQ